MPSVFPGPSRSRVRPRRSSRYPSTSYVGPLAGRATYDGEPASLTRRGLMATAALLAAGGAAEAIRKLAGGSSSRDVGGPPGLGQSVEALIEGHPPTSAARPATKPSASSTPTLVPHSHGHSHGHSHSPATGGHSHSHGTTGHETKRQRARRLREEHVDLPPARLNVRRAPVYQLDQLIPDAPKHAIALTIDDGPDPLYTPTVLRLLDKYQTQASFCVVGVHADAYPKLVRDIASAGHIIVNHSYSHALPFSTLPEKRIVTEITRTQAAIENASGVTPQLFRAPGGDWSTFILEACAAYGVEPLDWDVDPRDWARPGTKKIVKRMLKARPGEIVLCHDGGGNRTETVKALRKVLPSWQRRGLKTIPLRVTSPYLTGPDAAATPSTSASPTTS